jgi:hypothetical protein
MAGFKAVQLNEKTKNEIRASIADYNHGKIKAHKGAKKELKID